MIRGRARGARATSAGLLVAANVLGACAFLYPFLLGAAGGETSAHASDAPYLFAVLTPLLLGVAVAEVRSGRLDARHVALLGVLAAINAMLRLPGSLAGANLMFFLPIVCGFVFGPGFGFLLGASSMAVAGIITGGAGPWLPFQVWAMGWLGAGAGLLRPLRGAPHGVRIAGLAAYGWVAGLAFGALMNLWFWPYLQGSPAISWEAGIGAAEAASRYWRFYAATSLAWDSARALGIVAMTAVFGGPALRALERFHRRFDGTWEPLRPWPAEPAGARPRRSAPRAGTAS